MGGIHHWSRKDRKSVPAESSDNSTLTLKEAGWGFWSMMNLGPILFKYNEIFTRKRHLFFFFFLLYTLEQRTEQPWRHTSDIKPSSKSLSPLFSADYRRSWWKLVSRTTFIKLEDILLPSPTQEQNRKKGKEKEKNVRSSWKFLTKLHTQGCFFHSYRNSKIIEW